MSWPSRIDRQRRVGPNLDVRAVVVAMVFVAIETVLSHPLDDLQNALVAIDVGEADVGLMK